MEKEQVLHPRFNLFSRLKWLAGYHDYREVFLYEDDPTRATVKKNYKDDKLIGEALLAYHWSPPVYLDDDIKPIFAQGKCRIIGQGDYKIVVVDEGSDRNEVFKLYKSHSYVGDQAEEKARAAAAKIKIIHNTVRKIAPGFLLPSDLVIDKIEGRFRLWERQKRAGIVPIDFFPPKIAERLRKQAHEAATACSRLIQYELQRRNLATIDPLLGTITDNVQLTAVCWDFITNHLVSLDVVDCVDITPLLSSSNS